MLSFGPQTAFGFGSQGGGGGGGTLTGANDGLSLSGTTVQLGQETGALGDPGQLLDAREIPFNGNSLTFIERATGSLIEFNTGDPSISVRANVFENALFSMSDVGAGPGQNRGLLAGATTGGRDPSNFFQLKYSGNADDTFAEIDLSTSGATTVTISNIGYTAANDTAEMLQVLGNAKVDNSFNTDNAVHTLHVIAQTSSGGNNTNLIVDGLGNYFWTSNYQETNGGQFQGVLNLNQSILFNSPSESQQAFNSNVFVHWESDEIGNVDIIAFNEAQVQMNLNAAGDPNPAQITVGSSVAYYGANWWAYRGMNPLGSGGVGALTINSSGTQTGTERPLPLGSFASRIDFNNGGTVDVTGTMAGFVSDIVMGAPGSLTRLIDFSAGNIFDSTAGAFLIGTRIGFYVNNLTAGVGVTTGYAFFSEGAGDISYLAGKLIIGGTNPPVPDSNALRVNGTTESFSQFVSTTDSQPAIFGTENSTYDTTAGNLISYGGKFISAGSKAAGLNNVISIGLYATTAGLADTNFAAVFDVGNVIISGEGFVSPLVDTGDSLQVTGTIQSSILVGSGNRPLLATSSGQINAAPVGFVPEIKAAAELTGRTGTFTVLTFTSPTLSTYLVAVYVAITAITAGTLTLTVTFVDENGTPRTTTLFPMGTSTAGLIATGFTAFPVICVRSHATNNLNVVATFAGTSISYDCGASITLIE